MKTFLLILTCCCIFLFGCNLFQSKTEVIDFIPGTYITNWVSQYSETRDTLQIEPLLKKGSSAYSITRRTCINYPELAGKKEPQYKIVHWTGSYNAGGKTVMVDNNARILSFDPEAKEMKMGIVSYKKL